jgi:uncharacterized protein YjiS (DUF1127 family)
MLEKLMIRLKGLVMNITEYNDTLYNLNRMTDRELSDIGVTRADIPEIAKGKFRKKAA